jgi:hypothetical protein
VTASNAETEDLLQQFRDTLVEMDRGRVETGGNPRQWNRLVNRVQTLQLALRETAEGRAGITAFVGDEVATVRQWSASLALAWDEPVARAELEREATGSGLGAMEAKIILREFDTGRLNMTWEPKTR